MGGSRAHFVGEALDARLWISTREDQDQFINSSGFNFFPAAQPDDVAQVPEERRPAGIRHGSKTRGRDRVGCRPVPGVDPSSSRRTLLSVSDKNGPPSHVADMLSFMNVVGNLGLVDLPISNQAFTWTNGRPSPTLEWLDRVFICTIGRIVFPDPHSGRFRDQGLTTLLYCLRLSRLSLRPIYSSWSHTGYDTQRLRRLSPHHGPLLTLWIRMVQASKLKLAASREP